MNIIVAAALGFSLSLNAFAQDKMKTPSLPAPPAPGVEGPEAYYISEIAVHDMAAMKPYAAKVAETLVPYGGKFKVRRGRVAHLEGTEPKGAFVMIAFPSLEKAEAWYNSPAYARLKPIRHSAAKSRVIILEGISK